jgi:alpha-N-acetylglucosamine transferase
MNNYNCKIKKDRYVDSNIIIHSLKNEEETKCEMIISEIDTLEQESLDLTCVDCLRIENNELKESNAQLINALETIIKVDEKSFYSWTESEYLESRSKAKEILERVKNNNA